MVVRGLEIELRGRYVYRRRGYVCRFGRSVRYGLVRVEFSIL